MGNQMQVQFVIILIGEICLRIQFRAVRIAANKIYLESLHIWKIKMFNFPFLQLIASETQRLRLTAHCTVETKRFSYMGI